MTKNKFIASLTALRPDNNSQTAQSAVMDRRFTITKNVVKKMLMGV
ncbi:MAG: hypothetical protein IPM85_09890 [Chitinophagaceae bacterium]|nr:hypothetical protein [Chitinophagaceae bacterium]